MRKENQIINNQTMTTQPKLSTKVKTKSKPMSSSMQMKNVLSNHQANEKHKALDSLPITGSQSIGHTQLQKSERKEMPNRAKKRKSSYQGQERPRNPKFVPTSKLMQEIYKSMI
jgi:hypothetical protein